MIIDRETAIARINDGLAQYAGCVKDDPYGLYYHGAWIVDDLQHQRTDHVILTDGEDLCGCLSCGQIVRPEDDKTGCECHCPHCDAAL